MNFDKYEASSSLNALLLQETKPYYDLRRLQSYISPSPLEHNNHNNNISETITVRHHYCRETWRVSIAEWIFGVIDFLDLNRDVAALAMDFVDRYCALANTKNFNNRSPSSLDESKLKFQKVAVGALYLAMKVHGHPLRNNRPVRPTLRFYAELGRGLFTEQEIEDMEFEILQKLSWYIHPPTASTFVAIFLLELKPLLQHNPRSRIFEQSVFMTEISVCIPDFSFYFKPSVVAFAAILAAEEVMRLRTQERILPQYIMSAFVNCLLDWTKTPMPVVRDCQQCLMLAAPTEDLQVPAYGVIRPESTNVAANTDTTELSNLSNRTNRRSSVVVSPTPFCGDRRPLKEEVR
mmetsp:Transcript_19851/g.28697  ORF Transcript_19851/g.28697 Transcript_19851/m.28697 type:complete len:349 (+) Transcript_19851:228-1274(+)|eukprot:CAMPEP_0202464266 /NCGR_PEP_ID=MMETSP1360-20130828/61403_1 /ASSEMBLY_ACC=CAM_ASM_000848 /TAXON_ID=515479 /ORGANISM="Licmophora paradoxa, Strain CCMP2313" /LENGTH=348 /DNA_ID=CAMNT_0049087515 /DNA_START=222 /DNA_END=1268 /DNA_ORIENTATION=-